MKEDFKETRFSLIMFYATALVLAVMGRVSVLLMKANGQFFDYYNISASQPLFKQLVDAVWPAQLLVLVGVAMLAMVVLVGTIFLVGRFVRTAERITSGEAVRLSLVWALIGLVAACVCLGIVAGGLFTPSQTGGLMDTAPKNVGTVAISVLAASVTLVMGAMMGTVGCILAKRDAGSAAVAKGVAIFWMVFGAVTVIVFTFVAIALMGAPLPVGTIHMRLWAGVIANLIALGVGVMLARKALAAR